MALCAIPRLVIGLTRADGFVEHIPTKILASGKPMFSNYKITAKTAKSSLGKFLMLAAALFEAMEAHSDQKLIEK